MRFVPRSAWPLLPLLLFACREQPSAPVQQRGPAAGPPGLMEITITGIGTPQQKASVRSVSAGPAASRTGDAAQGALSRGARIVLGPGRLTTLPDTTTTPHNGTVQITPVSTASFTWGTRGSGGYRYVSATYQVRNAASGGAAYADDRTNLTFLAINDSVSLSGTAISTLRKFDNGAVAAGVETTILPTGWADLSGTATLTTRSADVLQVYTEAEVGALTLPSGVNSILPYGFVVSNPSTPGSRTLTANPGVSQFDGLVTFAFKVPLQATAADDPFTISIQVLPVDDNQAVVTQSFEEADATSVTNAKTRASSLGASLRSLIGTWLGTTPASFVCLARTAGTAGSPTAFLGDSIAISSESPTPYAGAASFLAKNATLSATFSETMSGASAGSFVVNGSQSGRAFLSGAYTGGSTATLTSPVPAFFPGERVDVTLTRGLTGTGNGARVCAPRVYRYRVATSAATANFAADTGAFTAGTQPRSVAVGDINHDGNLDLAVANFSGGAAGSVTVLLGDGAGGFNPASGSPVNVGLGPLSVALADVNGDGALDLVTANFNANTVAILLGHGNGTFAAPSTISIGAGFGPADVHLGDLNGDGKLDLVVADYTVAKVSVYLGDGAGGFTAASGSPFSVGTNPNSVTLADVNGDGALDIVTANAGSNNVTVLLGDGTGNFSAATGSPFSMGSLPYYVVVADVNGDGLPDLLTANNGGDNVSVRLANGSGGFDAATSVSVGTGPYMLSVGDVNGDGKLDLVTANTGSDNVSVMLGDGSGGFTAATNSPFGVGSGSAPRWAALGAFQNDGKLGIATANFGAASAVVLLSQ